jgi:Protein of unknown function (DUF4199)
MENQQTSTNPTTTKVGLKYGVFTAVALLLVSFVAGLLLPGDSAGVFLTLFVFFAGIAYGMIEFRRNNDNSMTFGQGFGLGMLVSAIVGLIHGTIAWLTLFMMGAKAIDEQKQKALVQLEKYYSDEEIEKAKPMLEWMFSPGFMFFLSVIGFLFLGLIVTLFASMIFRREKSPFE